MERSDARPPAMTRVDYQTTTSRKEELKFLNHK